MRLMPLAPTPSMVTIFLPATVPTGVTHERVGCPSTCTVQAPHWAMPQPYLVPASFSSSRSTHKRGISGSTSTSWTRPFTFNLVMEFSGREIQGESRFCYHPPAAARSLSPGAGTKDADIGGAGRARSAGDGQLRPVAGGKRVLQDGAVLGHQLRVVRRGAVVIQVVGEAVRVAVALVRATRQHARVGIAAGIAVVACEHRPRLHEGAL